MESPRQQISKAMERARRQITSGWVEGAELEKQNALRLWESCPDPKPPKPDLTTEEWREGYTINISKAMERAGRHITSGWVEGAELEKQNALRLWESCPDPKPPKPDLTIEELREGLHISLAAAANNMAWGWVAGAESAQIQAHSIWMLLHDLNVPEPQQSISVEEHAKSRLCLPCQEANDESSCAICQDDILLGQNESELYCTHVYHYHCIEKWAILKLTCPQCRKGLDKYLVKEV